MNAGPRQAGLRGQGTFQLMKSTTPSPSDGMLYSGTMNNFLGSESILIRTLGSQPVLKTDNFLRWLQCKNLSPTQHRSGPLLFPRVPETWQFNSHVLQANCVQGSAVSWWG